MNRGLLESGIREGNSRKGYCTECLRIAKPDKRKVSVAGEFYCSEHLSELGIEETGPGLLDKFMDLFRHKK